MDLEFACGRVNKLLHEVAIDLVDLKLLLQDQHLLLI